MELLVYVITGIGVIVGGGVAIWSLMLTHKEKKKRAARAQKNADA